MSEKMLYFAPKNCTQSELEYYVFSHSSKNQKTETDLRILSERTLTIIRSDSLSSKKLGRNGFLCPQKKVRERFEAEKILWTDQRTQDQIDPLQHLYSIHAILICISSEEFY